MGTGFGGATGLFGEGSGCTGVGVLAGAGSGVLAGGFAGLGLLTGTGSGVFTGAGSATGTVVGRGAITGGVVVGFAIGESGVEAGAGGVVITGGVVELDGDSTGWAVGTGELCVVGAGTCVNADGGS